jgi:THO complex subunit 2
LSLVLVASFLTSFLFSRNCGLAEKIVGRPVPILDNPLAPQPAQNFVELRESVIPMLLALGPSVHYDPVLMYKVLRLAKAALTQVMYDIKKLSCLKMVHLFGIYCSKGTYF